MEHTALEQNSLMQIAFEYSALEHMALKHGALEGLSMEYGVGKYYMVTIGTMEWDTEREV